VFAALVPGNNLGGRIRGTEGMGIGGIWCAAALAAAAYAIVELGIVRNSQIKDP